MLYVLLRAHLYAYTTTNDSDLQCHWYEIKAYFSLYLVGTLWLNFFCVYKYILCAHAVLPLCFQVLQKNALMIHWNKTDWGSLDTTKYAPEASKCNIRIWKKKIILFCRWSHYSKIWSNFNAKKRWNSLWNKMVPQLQDRLHATGVSERQKPRSL